ncbi:hypothetical protein M8J76_002417 [Diaphorina citri]|nr:hypothetical protein M8J75_010510 [Diaphorina citri]KAI5744453.1 hypothetical protein M8J76_002417 [Diaphorina citri]
MDGLINSGPGELNQPEDTDHLLESEEDEFPQKSGMYNPMHDIFPGVNDDYTKISWIHAVNSQDKLAAALKDPNIMMLEADVIIGSLKGDPKQTKLPVMGHPPATESDLSLDQFMNTISNREETIGMKLDFKSIDAFLAAQPVIGNYYGKLAVPLWLNADILKGPVNAPAVPVDANQFLNTSVHHHQDAILSIGWTTSYPPEGKYTKDDHIEPMLKTLNRNKVLTPVTFPVRAVFAAQSIELLQFLIDTSPLGSSLTIWMSTDSDKVCISKLKDLIRTIGKDRIFLDVPEFIREKLNSNNTEPCPQEDTPKAEADSGIFGISWTTLLIFGVLALILVLVGVYMKWKSRIDIN